MMAAIYALALEKMGLTALECLYIGDGGSGELTGASKVGLRALLIEPQPGTVVSGYGWEAESWAGERIKSLTEIVS